MAGSEVEAGPPPMPERPAGGAFVEPAGATTVYWIEAVPVSPRAAYDAPPRACR